MEVWQAAAVLKADLTGPQDDLLERLEAEKHTLAERAAKIRGDKPAEEDITAQIMRQMGIRTE